MGPRSEWVVSGSDDGHIFIWGRESGRLVQLLHGDRIGAVNCLEPHPNLPLLATSGLENDAKVRYKNAVGWCWVGLGWEERCVGRTKPNQTKRNELMKSLLTGAKRHHTTHQLWRPTAAKAADPSALRGHRGVTAEALMANNTRARQQAAGLSQFTSLMMRSALRRGGNMQQAMDLVAALTGASNLQFGAGDSDSSDEGGGMGFGTLDSDSSDEEDSEDSEDDSDGVSEGFGDSSDDGAARSSSSSSSSSYNDSESAPPL